MVQEVEGQDMVTHVQEQRQSCYGNGMKILPFVPDSVKMFFGMLRVMPYFCERWR